MKQPCSMSIRKQLQLIVLGLMVTLFAFQLLMQSVVLGAMRSLYTGNVQAAIDRVDTEVRTLLLQQENAVAHIAGETETIAYGGTLDSAARYTMAYRNVLPLVRSACQNLPIEHLVIYDSTNAWYQFIGALPYQEYHHLRSLFEGATTLTSMTVRVDGQLCLATGMPLMTVAHNQPLQTGFVVALTGTDTMRAVLSMQITDLEETILLHDGVRILLSNNTALENLPLLDAPVSPSVSYVSSHTILDDLRVTVAIPRNRIFPLQIPFLLAFLVVALFSVLALWVTLSLAGRWFTRPIAQVVDEMGALKAGQRRLTPTGMGHIDHLVDGINGLIDRLEATRHEMLKTQTALFESELEKRSAQLILLKKQINAHFLYNCLIGIRSLCDEREYTLAGEMAEGVGLLMRYTHATEPTVNIFDEMIIIQRYVNVMNIRFRGRFHYTFDVDDQIVRFSMPRLLLQPLVENALVHGLERQTHTCRLHITGTLDGNTLLFTVADNGVGISQAKLSAIVSSLSHVMDAYAYDDLKGISLINIHKRVLTTYGEGYGLCIQSVEGKGTTVTLRIPAVPD